jgi:hypothetical protein
MLSKINTAPNYYHPSDNTINATNNITVKRIKNGNHE